MKKILANLPAFGVQAHGGAKNRPELVYEREMLWPPLDGKWDAVVSLKDGSYEPGPSAGDCLKGEFCGARFEGIELTSDVGMQNGIIASGKDYIYVIGNAKISMSGDATNDFQCIGTAVTALGGSHLTLNESDIETTGLVKSCTIATEGAVLHVNNSHLVAHGGVLPDDYDPTPGPGGMLTPPPGLGIGGTARAHLSMDHSQTFFYNSTIEADGWAAISTDASNGYVYVEADSCDIKVASPGYGIYSDGGCHVALKHCNVSTATHGAIMAGECSGLFENVNAVSGKYFIMAHDVMGTTEELADISIRYGQIRTGEEAILLKSCNSYIDIYGADISSESGVLIHAIVNPDECATPVNGKDVYGNNIVMTDVDLSGDIINDDTDRALVVNLSGSRLTGALQNVHLQLDASSRWTADKDSEIALIGETSPLSIDALEGVTIRAYALDGCSLNSMELGSGGRLEIIQ